MFFLWLIVGFIFLIKGADLFVDGSKSIAKILKVPSVIIGLTIVAMGTSAPEASVSINASIIGNNDIAISNVLGSNIFNSLVVVGLCASLMPFFTDKTILKRDLPINIIFSGLLLILLIDGSLSFIDGLILTILMISYIIIMLKEAIHNKTEDEVAPLSTPVSIIYILFGLGIIILGGNLVVNNASIIATNLGLSQNFIGLTIVAIGTSLPELVTSLVAVYKKDAGLALGNAIGSNIFNILFILGASSLLSPIHVLNESIIDCIIMIIVSIIMYIFAKTNKSFSKKEGLICVIAYIIYTIFLFIR